VHRGAQFFSLNAHDRLSHLIQIETAGRRYDCAIVCCNSSGWRERMTAFPGRRELITLRAGAAAAWPLAARAEASPKRPLIAWLSGGTPQLSRSFLDNFLRGMQDLGYLEGRNFE
jgi:hypothetical protein